MRGTNHGSTKILIRQINPDANSAALLLHRLFATVINLEGKMKIQDIILYTSNITFLVGAGISLNPPSNVPPANEMIDALLGYLCPEEENEKIKALSKSIQFEMLIEHFESVYSKLEFLDYLEEIKSFNFIHLFLAKAIINGNIVLTTNFDYLIEYALLRVIKEKDRSNIIPIITKSDYQQYAKIIHDLIRDRKLPLVKLHGSKKNVITGEICHGCIVSTIRGLLKEKEWNTVFQFEPYKAPLFVDAIKGRCLIVLGYSGSDEFDLIPTLTELKDIESVIWIQQKKKWGQVYY